MNDSTTAPAAAPEVPPNPNAAATAKDAPPAKPLTFARKTWVYSLGQSLCRLFGIILFDLRASGIENVPKQGGVLIVANHQSFLDPAMLGAKVKRPMSFLAKSELFTNKIFGGMIRAVNAFPVRQGEGDVGAVRETIKRLQEGHILVMFPEGGRCEDGEIAPLQTGVGLIVRRAGPTVTVVPAAVEGAFKAWPRGQRFPRCSKIRLKYGKPMDLCHLKAAEIRGVIDTEIRKLFAELRQDWKK
jgi:1-acyl-sn-glycerol-3-phosphate acyltransferase